MLLLLDDDADIIPRGLALTGLVLRQARLTDLVVRQPGITLACALVGLAAWGLW